MPFVDFHTHSKSKIGGTSISIECLNVEKPILIDPQALYTIGVHPWLSSKQGGKSYFETIQKLIAYNSVIGLGEVGLDKLKGGSMEEQLVLLKQQAVLAYNNNKPIVIHCVKAWDYLIKIKKSFSDNLPWAIHGFNGSVELAKQLIEVGFYLSVGPMLLKSQSKISYTINQIPLDRLFLETDDSDIRIDDLYDAASKKLGISVSKLENQLYSNYQDFFKVLT